MLMHKNILNTSEGRAEKKKQSNYQKSLYKLKDLSPGRVRKSLLGIRDDV